MLVSPLALLPSVIEAATEAGRMVEVEFHRPDGPRFSDHVTAPVDLEIELFLRERLTTLLPARFVGEEAGVVEGAANGWCWVVDPHDGTRAFLEGKRGSAVSIALLREGIPVLGVVFAPLSPDRGPDLVAWAEGAGITRNGTAVTIDLRNHALAAGDVVLLNHGAWQRPVWHGLACAPARFMPLPSIAYRLARVAVGDGIATQTLRPVNALDIAAGHALLLAAGGVLVTEDGKPVTYSTLGESHPSACFGGPPSVVEVLRARSWRGSTETRREARVTLTWPRVADEGRLDRAVGCLFGQAIGDALGAQVEFRAAGEIARDWPDGVRTLHDGGTWNTLAGQPTDDTELALALARTLVGRRGYDAEAVRASYVRWYESSPFDCGSTIRRALASGGAGKPDPVSQGNGSLMRVAPIGIWAGSVAGAIETAMIDAALTHPHPNCVAACGVFAGVVASGVNGAGPAEMVRVALELAAARGCEPVAEALRRAVGGEEPEEPPERQGWVLLAFGNAFFHLAAGISAEDALVRTVGRGGDTDTNAAIAGALLGAAYGRAAFPAAWVMPVLTCRPEAALGAAHPRPEEYWTDDLVDLAEALLASRGETI